MLSPTIRLVRPLGAGGMGAVWVADHLALRTQVVVKLLADGLATSPTALARFSREAAAASQVKSPHVVQMLDYGVASDGTPYIVMELLEGRDLGVELRRSGPMPLQRFAALFEQVAGALSRAHERGVIHRDIKPENIFLCDVGQREWFVKVLDFGIAKGSDNQSDLPHTRTGATVGTPYYMSPEQLEGAPGLDHRCDLWALGVVAFEALTGARPFQGDTYFAIAIGITQGPKVVPSQINRGLPPAVDAWFMRACARDLGQRFTNANEMAQALSAIAANPAQSGWNAVWSYQTTAAHTAFTPPGLPQGTPTLDARPITNAAVTGAPTAGAFTSTPSGGAANAKSRLPLVLGLLAALVALGAGGAVIALFVVPRTHPTTHRKPAAPEPAVSIAASSSARAAESSVPVVLDEIRFAKRDYAVGQAYDEESQYDQRLSFTAPQKGYGGALQKTHKRVEILATDGKAITRLKVTYVDVSFTATRLDGTQLQQVPPVNGKSYVIEADAQNGITSVRDEHGALAPALEDQAVRTERAGLGRPDLLVAEVPDTPIKRGDESAALADMVKRMFSGVDTPQFEGARAVLKDIVTEGKEQIAVFEFTVKETTTAGGLTMVMDLSGTLSVRSSDSRLIRCDIGGPQKASGRIEGTGASELKLTRADL